MLSTVVAVRTKIRFILPVTSILVTLFRNVYPSAASCFKSHFATVIQKVIHRLLDQAMSCDKSSIKDLKRNQNPLCSCGRQKTEV